MFHREDKCESTCEAAISGKRMAQKQPFKHFLLQFLPHFILTEKLFLLHPCVPNTESTKLSWCRKLPLTSRNTALFLSRRIQEAKRKTSVSLLQINSSSCTYQGFITTLLAFNVT